MRTFNQIKESVLESRYTNIVDVGNKRSKPYRKGTGLVRLADDWYMKGEGNPPRIQNNSFWHKYAVFWSNEYTRRHGRRRWPSWWKDVGGNTYYMLYDAEYYGDEQGPAVDRYVEMRLDGTTFAAIMMDPPALLDREEKQYLAEVLGEAMDDQLQRYKRERDVEISRVGGAKKRSRQN